MRDDRLLTTDCSPTLEMAPNESHRDQIAMTRLLDILASERRRNILAYVATCPDETVSRGKIVSALLDREHGGPVAVTHRECLEIDLHHAHLPKLAEAGIIDYDPTSETVEYRASGAVDSFLSQYLTSEEADS